MCGIVGYVGRKQAAPILFDGLAHLEYRGYDSAGVCVVSGGELCTVKVLGRLRGLIDRVEADGGLRGTVGIGHSRWATHGAPSELNAHPHYATNGRICLVHNGIIENYMALKERLTKAGKTFYSETDTEVAANLMEYHYERCGDLKTAIRKSMEELEGSYAFAILCSDAPDTIVAVKKDSPLIYGVSKGEHYIASDVPAILKYTRDVVYLSDGEMVELSRQGARFFAADGKTMEPKIERINWELAAAEKVGYPHFMLKEICEQPKVLHDTVHPRLMGDEVVFDGLKLTEDMVRRFHRIYIIACGSASYVGNLGKYILEKTCRIPTEVVLASEFRYATPPLGEDSLVLVISQSGETADTLAAMREANAQGAYTLAIVNVVGSAISKEARDVIYTWAGPEIAVATTKAYSTQLSVLYLLALYFGKIRSVLSLRERREIIEGLHRLPGLLESMLTDENLAMLQALATDCSRHHDAFFIGRNVDSATCLEGSLKLKEIAYLHSEAYPAGELKHGPISLIEDGTLVIALATVSELFDKTVSNIREVKARGAWVLGITTEDRCAQMEQSVDRVITVPRSHPLLQPSLNVVPLQLLAYYAALARGCDVDKPRNLAKSVTVE